MRWAQLGLIQGGQHDPGVNSKILCFKFGKAVEIGIATAVAYLTTIRVVHKKELA
jgi:hypothetical protein